MKANTSPEETDDLKDVSDDEFFAGLAVDDNGPSMEITDDEFFAAINPNKNATSDSSVERVKPSDFFKK